MTVPYPRQVLPPSSTSLGQVGCWVFSHFLIAAERSTTPPLSVTSGAMSVRPSQATYTPDFASGSSELVLSLLALTHSSSKVDKAVLVHHAWRCNDCAPIPGYLCPKFTNGCAELVRSLLALCHSSSKVDKAVLVHHAWRCNDCAPIPGHLHS